MGFDVISFIFADVYVLIVAQILSILAHVLLVIVIRSHAPVLVDHILEKCDSCHDDRAGFLSIETRNIMNRLGIENDLHETREASFLLLGLQNEKARDENKL